MTRCSSTGVPIVLFLEGALDARGFFFELSSSSAVTLLGAHVKRRKIERTNCLQVVYPAQEVLLGYTTP